MNVSAALLSVIALAMSSVAFLNMRTASMLQFGASEAVVVVRPVPPPSSSFQIQSRHDGLIEKLLCNILPTITRPQGGKEKAVVAEVRRTLWDRSLQASPDGEVEPWKTELEQIIYLPINKNAHTRMVIAMDDLADREGILIGAEKQFIKRAISNKTPNLVIRDVLDSHERLRNTTSRAFTILRDPIDRFISGTCQELLMGSRWLMCRNLASDPLDWIDCIIRNSALQGRFQHHQIPQVDHLATNLRDHPNLPISVLSVEQATDFMIELGVHDKDDTSIVRDRKSITYVASGGKMNLPEHGTLPQHFEVTDQKSKVANLCALKSQDLRPESVTMLCRAYAADVELLRSAQLEVPLCDGVA